MERPAINRHVLRSTIIHISSKKFLCGIQPSKLLKERHKNKRRQTWNYSSRPIESLNTTCHGSVHQLTVKFHGRWSAFARLQIFVGEPHAFTITITFDDVQSNICWALKGGSLPNSSKETRKGEIGTFGQSKYLVIK